MRLVTVVRDGRRQAGRVEGSRVVLLPYEDVGALLAADGWRQLGDADGTAELALADAEFAPVIPFPEKILCVGLNYRDHAEESRVSVPEFPPLFAKFWRCLVGPYEDVAIPTNSEQVDWEAELAVVVGRPLRHASGPEALEAIAGYTVMNDVSMRDWQLRTTQFLQGKAFERSTPLGPALVTLDELADPLALRIRCEIDGEVVQDASTSEMVMKPHQILAYISEFTTLMPGDVVATGTPAGVGAMRTPPMFIAPGQVVGASIEGVGKVANRFVG